MRCHVKRVIRLVAAVEEPHAGDPSLPPSEYSIAHTCAVLLTLQKLTVLFSVKLRADVIRRMLLRSPSSRIEVVGQHGGGRSKLVRRRYLFSIFFLVGVAIPVCLVCAS